MKSLNGADSLVEVKVHTGGDLVWESSFIADPIGVRLLKVASDCASRGHDDVRLLRPATNAEASGSHLVGEVSCSYWTLCQLFGKPDRVGCGSRVSWAFMYADNWLFTVYDWDKYEMPIEDVTTWNVGGHDKAVLPVVRGLVAEFLNH